MEMEVVMPVPASMDFNFDSACSSPYMTAPSSPQRFGNLFCSAPTSPSRISSSSSFYRDLNNNDQYSSLVSNSSNRLFNVEEMNNTIREDDEDFEFNFSGQLERTSLSADELFDGGKIKPLKPPTSSDSVPVILSSSSSKNSSKKNDLPCPSLEKLEDSLKRREFKEQERGRERVSSSSFSSSISRKGSRSLSPMRVSDIIYEQDDINPSQTERIISSTSNNTSSNSNTNTTPKSYASTFLSAISFSKSYRKWKLKDLLLFRSASEGRAACPDQLRTKYAVLTKKETEDVKNSSFRSTDSSGSVSRRRGPPVSAHELHYTANRAVAEEMKRKTFLPYKQGLLGCLGFNPGGVHDISRGVGSLTRV